MSMINPNASRGFSLLEVLITLVILATGLLGMASLMLNSMQSNHAAAERSAATLMAYNLVERMRSNRQEAAMSGSTYAGNPYSVSDPCSVVGACTNGMTPQQLAGNDLKAWMDNLQAILPGAQAFIAQDGTRSNDYCIVIFWPERAQNLIDANAAPCNQAAGSRAFSSLEVTL